jgi:hypothetical protein
VLEICADTPYVPITHKIVETVIHLNGALGQRSLVVIAEAVRRNPEYAADISTAEAVVSYLRQFLAEQRSAALSERGGARAVRQLLSDFGNAGHSGALELAYDFGDVFR